MNDDDDGYPEPKAYWLLTLSSNIFHQL
jgi:hypothetical protein